MSARSSAGRITGVVLVLVLAACSEQQPPSVDDPAPVRTPIGPTTRLAVPADPDVHVVAGAGGRPEQRGTADLETTVSSLDGGVVQTVSRRSPGGAWGMPDYTDREVYPRAVVVARPASRTESLSPELKDFDYGADFRLDAVSAGRPEDNGNNVLQRGLSSDRSMFKLEVDASLRPGCTVKGEGTAVIVRASQPVKPNIWYRVRCERRSGIVRILVSEYLPSGRIFTQARVRRGSVGAVSFVGDEVPFSLGGKVAHDGRVIRAATDQFNGIIDNAYFTMS